MILPQEIFTKEMNSKDGSTCMLESDRHTNKRSLGNIMSVIKYDKEINSKQISKIQNLETNTKKKRYFVQHTYIDRSQEIPEIYQTDRKVRGGTTIRIHFPLKLHQMLDEISDSGLSSIASWRSHGRAFIVHKREEFVQKILPFYFKQSKFDSFQRQLNLYGFTRISSGKDKGAYYHEMFIRGRHLLTNGMIRKKVKGNIIRGKCNPNNEPDFYSMPPISPLRKETLMKIYDFSFNLINDHMCHLLEDEIIKTFAVRI